MAMDGIGLADAIEMLRAEILEAQRRGDGAEAQFAVQALTVQFKVGLTKLVDGKPGFNAPFGDVGLGLSGGFHQETAEAVTVVLGPPVDRAGRAINVAQASSDQKG